MYPKKYIIYNHLIPFYYVFSTSKCNTRFANLDRKLHVESCILTFSSDDYLAHTQIWQKKHA